MSEQVGRFSVDLPEGWFRLDLRPDARTDTHRRLVDSWVEHHPELAPSRDALVDVLDDTANRALRTRCILAAASFGAGADGAPTWAALTVRVLPWPGKLTAAEFLTGMAAAARGDGEHVGFAEPVVVGRRRVLLVRQTVTADADADADAGAAAVSFVVPMPDDGVFANLEFVTEHGPGPAPEHLFGHIVASARVAH